MSLIDSLKKQIFIDQIQQKGVPSNFFSFFSPTAMPRMGEKQMLSAYQDGYTPIPMP
jgi:hypothetical protein